MKGLVFCGFPVSALTVTVLDLSASGALLDLPVETGAAGDHIRLGFAVDFEGDAMNLSISAAIRKIYRKENEGSSRIGLEFENVSQNDALVLHYFIHALSQVG